MNNNKLLSYFLVMFPDLNFIVRLEGSECSKTTEKLSRSRRRIFSRDSRFFKCR